MEDNRKRGQIILKIIFLDIDGVLNSEQYDEIRTKEQGNIDETRLPLLKYLVENTGAEIVLCSTWRKHWDKEEALCDKVGMELNDRFQSYGLTIMDKTPLISDAQRALEIQAWLNLHSESVENYVILDDNLWGWGDLISHLVRTSPRDRRGLEEEHIQKAIEILK